MRVCANKMLASVSVANLVQAGSQSGREPLGSGGLLCAAETVSAEPCGCARAGPCEARPRCQR